MPFQPNKLSTYTKHSILSSPKKTINNFKLFVLKSIKNKPLNIIHFKNVT